MGCTGLVGTDRGLGGTGRAEDVGSIGGLVVMILVSLEVRGGLSGLRGWDCTGLARAAA